MSDYYDGELISYLNSIDISNFIIISEIDNIVELMMKKFRFKYGRVLFTGSKNEKYMKSNSADISADVVSFINDLIKEKICNLDEKIIYIGDNLTKYGYEFYLYDLLRVIPYLVDSIPQHHYFLFNNASKLIYVSFEHDIQFGMQCEHDIHL